MITAVLIGAGGRGIGAYGAFALRNPEDIRFVGVADPDIERRTYFAIQHQIPLENQFSSFEELLSKPKMADTCFICTQDQLHVQPTLMAFEKGYDVFLEKPMAIAPKDCVLLENEAQKHHRKWMIGHVLRYTLFFSKLKELIDSKLIGDLMTIQHNENVGYYHMAHSYVRGNWRNTALSAPMILAKSCHDMDILMWLSGSRPAKVSSFGNLGHFKSSTQEKPTPKYCLDGCFKQDTCPYYAPKVYLNGPDWMKFPVSNDMSNEALLKALKNGPYGRCVYHSDNDVVDHQVVSILFENGMTAAFTMSGFTHEITRTIKIMGSLGEIRGHMDKNEIEVHVFGEDQPRIIHLDTMDYGHSGGDYGIMKSFVRYIEKGDNEALTSAHESVLSHLLSFAAEDSRLQSKTIDFTSYVQEAFQ